jgi:hypothetical protein
MRGRDWWRRCGAGESKEDSSFLKKRSTKLLTLCCRHRQPPLVSAARVKSLFASFSSEKEESSFYWNG